MDDFNPGLALTFLVISICRGLANLFCFGILLAGVGRSFLCICQRFRPLPLACICIRLDGHVVLGRTTPCVITKACYIFMHRFDVWAYPASADEADGGRG
ncbi:hypothetical protein HETIRDRAFT_325035 [Heterobasidion irregulare TC 32-1]|uniref:Uncharacterized protein n=1 Tax=Heterobasidion irregulare (strain TC 32-1) TaxID=747525 RepID=W4JWS7_HETIT|nr:uncharacterized protein HETIRDRAFT_325035 [Heterobasidion irregulare TC 32-1]ETW77909.1 hypothetical protein HETIRDRAFT_325035 [Heterobasidion irregulare TC 32-1]